VRFARPEWIAAAAAASDAVRAMQLADTPDGPRLRRASRADRVSDAAATLEDYGGFAGGLVRLALATGDPEAAVLARVLVEACIDDDGATIAAPGGGDPVLAARGIAVDADTTEGATPSGAALYADAALRLAELGGDDRLRVAAERALAPLLQPAVERPIAYGAALAVAARLSSPVEQLVVVLPRPDADGEVLPVARAWAAPGRTLAIVDERQAQAFAAAGFELFAARTAVAGAPTAYLCEGSVCKLPTADATLLRGLLAASA